MVSLGEMEERERIEIGELGREALSEWYLERESPKEAEEVPLAPPKPLIEKEPEVAVADPQQEEKAQVKAKVKELLVLGEQKGLDYAIDVARKSNNPLLLDLFHDVLAEDGNYKRILKR